MAQQMRKVTENRGRSSNPAHAILQSKIARLPASLAQKQQKAIIQRDTNFQNQQLRLMNKRRKMEEDAAERGMGMEAAKLGLTMGMSDFGGKTIGDALSGGSKALNKVSMGKLGSANPPARSNMFSDFNIGGAISSGLTGYGVGKLVGGGKTKKSLFGAGSGALMGLLASKPGQGLYSGLTGLISGGLGGYFS